ncbi:unnamed protein product [Pylaiella littoralis]
MRLSVFLILLPCVSAFVTPGPASTFFKYGRSEVYASSSMISMGAQGQPNGEGAWSVATLWRDMVGTATETKQKVDSTAADVYAELRRKVEVKKQRQSLEGQLSSLIRIEGNNMSCKVGGCVRRLASELEALQDNAAAFGSEKTGLAGSWKLIYSSAVCDGKAKSSSNDVLKSIEEISYVSENYRISRSENDVLRVYRRVTAPRKSTAAAAAVAPVGAGARAAPGDDTSAAMDAEGPFEGKNVAGRTSATAAGRRLIKQPLRKRLFFGFLRR